MATIITYESVMQAIRDTSSVDDFDERESLRRGNQFSDYAPEARVTKLLRERHDRSPHSVKAVIDKFVSQGFLVRRGDLLYLPKLGIG